MLAGAAAIAVSTADKGIFTGPNISSALMLAGIALAITGIIKVLADINGKGIPYLAETNSRLKKYELPYDLSRKENVCDCIASGDLEALMEIPRGESSSVLAIIYKSMDGEVVFAQPLVFIPHTHRPVAPVSVFHKGEYIRSAKLD